MIYLREFKRNLKSLLIWSIILGGLILMMLLIYPQFAMNQQEMNDMIKAFPDSMKNIFGMDKLDFGTVLGYYGVEIYLINTLMGSIYASILASNIVAKEQNEKTIEFLLSKPVLRREIVTQKLLLVVTNILILNAIALVCSLIGFAYADESVQMDAFLLLMFATFMLHLCFGAISFLLSTIMNKTRNIVSVSLGIVLTSYFLHVMSGLTDKLENLKYLSFFRYVDAADIITEVKIEPLYLVIMLIVIVVSFVSSFVVYQRKDISV